MKWLTRLKPKKRGSRKPRACGNRFPKPDPLIKEPGWDDFDRQDIHMLWILGKRR